MSSETEKNKVLTDLERSSNTNRFFEILTTFCNLVYLICIGLRYYSGIHNTSMGQDSVQLIQMNLLIIGLFMAPLLNIVWHFMVMVRMLAGKKNTVHIWFQVLNTGSLLIQVFYTFL